MATMALDESTNLQPTVARVTTLRAAKAIGPTELKQRLLALFLSTKAVHEVIQTHPGLKLYFALAHRVSLFHQWLTTLRDGLLNS